MKIGILLAAGTSTRFGEDKLFASFHGKPVIYHSLKLLCSSCEEIFIACSIKNKKKIVELIRKEKFNKVSGIFLGGATRFDSVRKVIKNVLSEVGPHDLFIIHNAANPGATQAELKSCIQALAKNIAGVAPGRRVTSTLKKVTHNVVQETLDRRNMWEVETPQVVHAPAFISAIKVIKNSPTDDLSILENAGMKTRLIQASPTNRKITYQEDLPRNFLVGIGEDSHAYGTLTGQKLGGVYIKNMPRVKANSDGDVILHALCNAISSALGEGSLGTYADALYKKGVRDSAQYVKKVLLKMQQRGYVLYNCSIALEGSRPRIDPLVSSLKEKLSQLLKIHPIRIGITATSGEDITMFGKGEAIHCQAIVSLKEKI